MEDVPESMELGKQIQRPWGRHMPVLFKGIQRVYWLRKKDRKIRERVLLVLVVALANQSKWDEKELQSLERRMAWSHLSLTRFLRLLCWGQPGRESKWKVEIGRLWGGSCQSRTEMRVAQSSYLEEFNNISNNHQHRKIILQIHKLILLT